MPFFKNIKYIKCHLLLLHYITMLGIFSKSIGMSTQLKNCLNRLFKEKYCTYIILKHKILLKYEF